MKPIKTPPMLIKSELTYLLSITFPHEDQTISLEGYLPLFYGSKKILPEFIQENLSEIHDYRT